MNTEARTKIVAVYLLVDAEGHARYVGITRKLKARIEEHRRRKPWMMSFFVLQYVLAPNDIEAETRWISYFRSLGFTLDNKTNGGCGTRYHNAIAKRRMSIAQSGKKRKPMSAEGRENIRQSRLGKKLSEDTKRKIGESSKGRVVSPETCKKISEAKFAQSPATKNKISVAHKGRNHGPISEVTRTKLREANKGRKITWGDKISKATKGRKAPPGAFKVGHDVTDDTRRKISESNKAYFAGLTPEEIKERSEKRSASSKGSGKKSWETRRRKYGENGQRRD